MKIYKVQRIGDPGYDELAGVVVKAKSPEQALQMTQEFAAETFGDRSLTEENTVITEITHSGSPEIVLYDFNES